MDALAGSNTVFGDLMILNNIIDDYHAKKGHKTTFDLSKGTSGTTIKSGSIDNMKDLKIKQGKGTGLEENALISGATTKNYERDHKAAVSGTAEERQKAHDDIWAIADFKEKAMDNIKFPWDKMVVLMI